MGVPFPDIILPDGQVYQQALYEKQASFHQSSAKHRMLAGSIGGGKSAAATVEIIKQCWLYKNNYGFILRQSMPKLKRSAMKDFDDLLPPWMRFDSNQQDNWVDVINQYGFKFMQDNGLERLNRRDKQAMRAMGGVSRIEFTSFEGNWQVDDKFTSSNIGFFMIEQAEEASFAIYKALNQRMRRTNAGRKALYISNPSKWGKDWLWKLFHPDSPHRRPKHEMWNFDIEDNPALPDDYVEQMFDQYDEDEQARLLHGSYDHGIGAMYPELDEGIHVIPHFEPPMHWPKAIGIDHGLVNPTAVVFLAKDPDDGTIYMYDEYYAKEQLISQHVAVLKPKITKQHVCRMIDPTAYRRSAVDFNSPGLEYGRLGLPLAPSSRDLSAGINRVREYLRVDPTRKHPFKNELGAPRLFFMDNCKGAWEEMTNYKKDQHRSGTGQANEPEKPWAWNDHFPDALRYAMVGFATSLSPASKIDDVKIVDTVRPWKRDAHVNETPVGPGYNPKAKIVDISGLIGKASKDVPQVRGTSWTSV